MPFNKLVNVSVSQIPDSKYLPHQLPTVPPWVFYTFMESCGLLQDPEVPGVLLDSRDVVL